MEITDEDKLRVKGTVWNYIESASLLKQLPVEMLQWLIDNPHELELDGASPVVKAAMLEYLRGIIATKMEAEMTEEGMTPEKFRRIQSDTVERTAQAVEKEHDKEE